MCAAPASVSSPTEAPTKVQGKIECRPATWDEDEHQLLNSASLIIQSGWAQSEANHWEKNCADLESYLQHQQQPHAAPNSAVLFAPEETILLFDWDDSFLPSSWIRAQGIYSQSSVLTAWQDKELAEMAVLAAETLHKAKWLGTVVLVTNAEQGWIERSCQKFMPSLCSSLHGVRLLSARSMYESTELRSPIEWKTYAFEDEIERLFAAEVLVCPKSRKNVLSLGDSMCEREALWRATSDLPNTRSKSFKFIECPNVNQLRMEHSFISQRLEQLVHYDGNLDLCLHEVL